MNESGDIYADLGDKIPEADRERLERYFQDAQPDGVLTVVDESLSKVDVEKVRAAFVARHSCS